MLYLVIGIIILIALTVAYSRKRARAPYKIIVLGPPLAGKTLLLASMHYRLSIQDPDLGFFLETDEKEPLQRSRLLAYRKEMEAANKDFIPPTQLRELTEWKFICQVKSADGKFYPVMRFSYLDYAGERIQLLYDANKYTPEFQTMLDKADALLGMLDGQVLLKLMAGKGDDSFYREHIDAILPILQRSNQPVHFIITKWDLLENQYSLDAILTRLLDYQPFAHFVTTHAGLSTLRLIPVSAVGPGFAKLQPDGKTMSKIPGAQLHPFQVEMPLASVLYDSLGYSLKKSGLHNKRWFNRLPSAGSLDLITTILLFVAWIIGGLTMSLGPFALSFQGFFAGITSLQAGSLGSSNANKVIHGEKDAVEQVINGTWTLLNRLEHKFPESNLTKYVARSHP